LAEDLRKQAVEKRQQYGSKLQRVPRGGLLEYERVYETVPEDVQQEIAEINEAKNLYLQGAKELRQSEIQALQDARAERLRSAREEAMAAKQARAEGVEQ
jgi:hypothetical protein